jgi:hypothetical protein
VVRTNLSAAHSDAAATVRACKGLSGVEHAFRSLKTVDLELRPVFHWTAPRVPRCCSTSPTLLRATRSEPRQWLRPEPLPMHSDGGVFWTVNSDR